MSKQDVPEVALAAAVIQRVAADLRRGSPANKRRAREDVAAGGLEFWIGVLDAEYEVGEIVKGGLRMLAESGERLAS